MRRRGSAAGAAGWVLLAGSVVLVDPTGLLPATALRWAVVVTAVLGLVAAGRARPAVPRPVAVLVVALLALVAASAVAGVDPVRGWIGHPRRNLGVLTWVAFAGAGWLGAVAGRAPVGRRSAAKAATVGALLVAATTAGELAGYVPSGLGFDGARAGGWYAQPVTLGAAAVLLGFAALGAAADLATGPRWRVAGAVGALGCVAALLATQTRGAWIGAGVGTVLALPTLRRALPRPSPEVLAAGLLAVVAVLAVSPVGSRLTSALDEGGTGRGRFDEWRIASDVVADRPLLGVGPEGYRIVAPSLIDERYAEAYGRDVVVDRAHGGPLDVAVASGVPAATVYVVLVVMVVLAAWRLQRRAPATFAAGAGAGVAAFAVAQLSAFPTAEVDPAAWYLAGLVVAAAHGTRAPVAVARPTRVALPLRVVAGGVAAAALWAGGTGVSVDRSLGQAVRAAEGGDLTAAMEHADRATRLRPDHPDAWYVAARLAARGPSLLDVDAALHRVEAGRGHVPDDPALEQLRVELLATRAIRSGLPADRRAAVEALRARLDVDPTHPVARRLLAELTGPTDAGSAR